MAVTPEITNSEELFTESPVEIASWAITISFAQKFYNYIEHRKRIAIPENAITKHFMQLLNQQELEKVRTELVSLRTKDEGRTEYTTTFEAHRRMSTVKGDFIDGSGNRKALANRAFLAATMYLESPRITSMTPPSVNAVSELLSRNQTDFVPHYLETAQKEFDVTQGDTNLAATIAWTQHDTAYWLDH